MHIAGKFILTHLVLLNCLLITFLLNIRSDWLLKFLYRTLSMHANGVAGLQAVESDDDRIENIDLTEIVSGYYLNNSTIIIIKITNQAKVLLILILRF